MSILYSQQFDQFKHVQKGFGSQAVDGMPSWGPGTQQTAPQVKWVIKENFQKICEQLSP